jgi:hypothetical protein
MIIIIIKENETYKIEEEKNYKLIIIIDSKLSQTKT